MHSEGVYANQRLEFSPQGTTIRALKSKEPEADVNVQYLDDLQADNQCMICLEEFVPEVAPADLSADKRPGHGEPQPLGRGEEPELPPSNEAAGPQQNEDAPGEEARSNPARPAEAALPADEVEDMGFDYIEEADLPGVPGA